MTNETSKNTLYCFYGQTKTKIAPEVQANDRTAFASPFIIKFEKFNVYILYVTFSLMFNNFK